MANKIVDGTQMTICFHVDDCKLSHGSSRANDNVIDWLRQEYKSIFEDGSGEMTVSRGRVHKYLGMTLDYTVHGQVNSTYQCLITSTRSSMLLIRQNPRGWYKVKRCS
jgi:hypothetical protein